MPCLGAGTSICIFQHSEKYSRTYIEIRQALYTEGFLTKLTRSVHVIIGTLRSKDEDDYEYEFSVLSTRTSKNVGLQTLCASSVRKTRTRCRRHALI